MPTFNDALRGYASPILKRDKYRCRYCGLDGANSFNNWLTLTQDHLLPIGHEKREDPEFIVTACSFCNVADNQYFKNADSRGITLEGKTPSELVEQRLPFVLKTRNSYREFWAQNVAPKIDCNDELL